MDKNNQYNSVFISDVHLGFLGCKAEKLYEFLNKLNCKNLFLVGDIIDFWAMKDNFYWPKEHQKGGQEGLESSPRGDSSRKCDF